VGEIGIVALSSAGVVIVVAVLMFMLGRSLADAERRYGDARTSDANKAIVIAAREATIVNKDASIKTITDKATYWEDRFNALSVAFDEAVAALPDDDHRARVLARAAKAHANDPAGDDRSAGSVPDERPPPASLASDTDLERPE